MQIHQLKRKSANKDAKLVGRGGKRGKTSGKGTKGQNARSGRKKRPEMRDIIKKLPKKRGHIFDRVKASPFIAVNLITIDKVYVVGEVVSPETLFAKGIIRKFAGYVPEVKILANGGLTKALNFNKCTVSESARLMIEKAGGKIEAIAPKITVKNKGKTPKVKTSKN